MNKGFDEYLAALFTNAWTAWKSELYPDEKFYPNGIMWCDYDAAFASDERISQTQLSCILMHYTRLCETNKIMCMSRQDASQFQQCIRTTNLVQDLFLLMRRSNHKHISMTFREFMYLILWLGPPQVSLPHSCEDAFGTIDIRVHALSSIIFPSSLQQERNYFIHNCLMYLPSSLSDMIISFLPHASPFEQQYAGNMWFEKIASELSGCDYENKQTLSQPIRMCNISPITNAARRRLRRQRNQSNHHTKPRKNRKTKLKQLKNTDKTQSAIRGILLTLGCTTAPLECDDLTEFQDIHRRASIVIRSNNDTQVTFLNYDLLDVYVSSRHQWFLTTGATKPEKDGDLNPFDTASYAHAIVNDYDVGQSNDWANRIEQDCKNGSL